ncbi:MAG: hypothetical protein E6447_21515, partial [Bradyrhizobium sp.]|nr:hypothetical protein [Bradyrhizobium sp.]
RTKSKFKARPIEVSTEAVASTRTAWPADFEIPEVRSASRANGSDLAAQLRHDVRNCRIFVIRQPSDRL